MAKIAGKMLHANGEEPDRQTGRVSSGLSPAIADQGPSAPPAPLNLAHFSDTHLGYQAYSALSMSGENQRALDFVKAFVAVCQEIIAEDPPLVIHSGDVADRPRIDVRYLLLIKSWFVKLAGIRADGSRRQLVVIGGNHDLPRYHKEVCFLELFSDLPGVHIVTNRYEELSFLDQDAPTELAGVSVHALPHDQLKSVDFADVQPTPERLNILVAHGVAGGSELYRRTIGREYPIPSDVLGRSWDYVALGHYHKQGPVPLASHSFAQPDVGHAWYAGSTENNGFRDVRDGTGQRGWLSVAVEPGELPDVTRRNIQIRPMFRLPVLDAAGMSPEEVAASLTANVRASEIRGAVVGQVVTGIRREVWALVDQHPARDAASEALHYSVAPRFAVTATDGEASTQHAGALGDLDEVLTAAAQSLPPDERLPALTLARRLLGSVLTAPNAPRTEATQGDDTGETRPTDAQPSPPLGPESGEGGTTTTAHTEVPPTPDESVQRSASDANPSSQGNSRSRPVQDERLSQRQGAA